MERRVGFDEYDQLAFRRLGADLNDQLRKVPSELNPLRFLDDEWPGLIVAIISHLRIGTPLPLSGSRRHPSKILG